MTHDEVVSEITRRAWRFNVLVLVSPDDRLIGSDGLVTGGCFDETVPSLSISQAGTPQATLGLLLHEYSHLTQWVENCPEWAAHQKTPGMWDWLAGKPLKGAAKVVDATQALEADCERRTVRLIRELAAPIDVAEYCRRANAYIHFHNVIKAERKWYKAPGALFVPEILRHCNDSLDSNFTKTPKPLFDAMVTHAI